MLPQLAPAGLDGLSLCGSKASFVQGACSRPVSFLPSSKPHVRPADTRSAAGGGRTKDLLSGRLVGRPRPDGGDAQQDRATGSVWGVKVKRAKEAIVQAKQLQIPRHAGRVSARSAGASSGATALAVDGPCPASDLGGAELAGWGEADSDNLFNYTTHDSQHVQAPAEDAIAGKDEISKVRSNGNKVAERISSARRAAITDTRNNPDEKENNPRPACSEGKPPQARQAILQIVPDDRHCGEGGLSSCGAGGGAFKRVDKDALVPQTKLRLGARSRVPSCPEPRDTSRNRVTPLAPHSSKDAASHAASTRRGTVPTLTGNTSKGRLATTLPTLGLQRFNSDDTTQMHSMLSVVQAVVPSAVRRARSADDPPFSGAGGDTEDGENDIQSEVKEPKAPVDLAALQQKARERIAAKKKKEKLQMEEWEAQQEKTKRERLEVKEGVDAEAKQRRAAVYALNYLMHQQEWGAWLQFEKDQKEGKSRPSSSTRSRPSSSKSKKSAKSGPSSAAGPDPS